MNSDVAVSVQAWCSLGAILGLFGAGFFKTHVGCRLVFFGPLGPWACFYRLLACVGSQIWSNFDKSNLSYKPLKATLKLARAGLHTAIPDTVLPIFQFQIFILAMAMRA